MKNMPEGYGLYLNTTGSIFQICQLCRQEAMLMSYRIVTLRIRHATFGRWKQTEYKCGILQVLKNIILQVYSNYQYYQNSIAVTQ